MIAIIAAIFSALPFLILHKVHIGILEQICSVLIVWNIIGLCFSNWIIKGIMLILAIILIFIPVIGWAIRKCLLLPKSALIWAALIALATIVGNLT